MGTNRNNNKKRNKRDRMALGLATTLFLPSLGRCSRRLLSSPYVSCFFRTQSAREIWVPLCMQTLSKRAFEARCLTTINKAASRTAEVESSVLENQTPDVLVKNLRLLKKLGATQEEVGTYIQMYNSVENQKFGVIKVGGGVIQDELDDLCASVAALYKFGLIPIIVHGAGPQLNDKLKELNIPSTYDEGLRVTTPEILKIARKTFDDANFILVIRTMTMKMTTSLKTQLTFQKKKRPMPSKSLVFGPGPSRREFLVPSYSILSDGVTLETSPPSKRSLSIMPSTVDAFRS